MQDLEGTFQRAESRLGEASQWKLKSGELGGIGTRIERLNLQLKQGNYYPDLLDEQSALLRERLRHIRK